MAPQLLRRAARMQRTNYHFPPRQLDRLRAESKAKGLPVAELIRRAIDAVYPESLAPEQG